MVGSAGSSQDDPIPKIAPHNIDIVGHAALCQSSPLVAIGTVARKGKREAESAANYRGILIHRKQADILIWYGASDHALARGVE